jgi:hypothetical protein
MESRAGDPARSSIEERQSSTRNRIILLTSIALQLLLGGLIGHYYDIPIFMATGYLVASGGNPYVAQDLTGVFGSSAFQGMNSVGYPPPWPLALGLIYRLVYPLSHSLFLYNLAIKIPVIAANVCLAYLAYGILKKQNAGEAVARKAWVFLLLNPTVLLLSSAWGQFDSIVALLSLLSLTLLYAGRVGGSAVLLALAVSSKPTALPILLVAVAWLMGSSPRLAIRYIAVFAAGVLVFCVAPFAILQWDPSPILEHWNAHFSMAGAMSFLTFFELVYDSYQLPGTWWLLGLAWIPALAAGVLVLGPNSGDLVDLLKNSSALVLVFFLTRAWLSEPNILLILPLVLILTSMGELDRRALAAVWILPLLFAALNTPSPQLLFPSFPRGVARILDWADGLRTARLVIRTAVVILWQVAGWWIVVSCLRKRADAARQPAMTGGLPA